MLEENEAKGIVSDNDILSCRFSVYFFIESISWEEYEAWHVKYVFA
jgi:hypothetical protein